MRAIAYLGRYRDQEIEVITTSHDVELGVVFINCLDCDGTGWIDWHPEFLFKDCITCKGTGKYPITL